MIATRTVEQANERRILRSIQAYLDGEQNCSRKWILGVIGAHALLANHLLLTRFAGYRSTPRFRDLQTSPVRQSVEVFCDCGEQYILEFETVLGANASLHFFSCIECERRHAVAGAVVDALRWDELSEKWTKIAGT